MSDDVSIHCQLPRCRRACCSSNVVESTVAVHTTCRSAPTETPRSLLLQRRICVPTSCSNEQLQQMALTLGWNRDGRVILARDWQLTGLSSTGLAKRIARSVSSVRIRPNGGRSCGWQNCNAKR